MKFFSAKSCLAANELEFSSNDLFHSCSEYNSTHLNGKTDLQVFKMVSLDKHLKQNRRLAQKLTASEVTSPLIKKLKTNQVGMWWSSGQHARLKLQRSTFKSHIKIAATVSVQICLNGRKCVSYTKGTLKNYFNSYGSNNRLLLNSELPCTKHQSLPFQCPKHDKYWYELLTSLHILLRVSPEMLARQRRLLL